MAVSLLERATLYSLQTSLTIPGLAAPGWLFEDTPNTTPPKETSLKVRCLSLSTVRKTARRFANGARRTTTNSLMTIGVVGRDGERQHMQ